MELLEEYKTKYDYMPEISEEINRENAVQHRLLTKQMKSLDIARESHDKQFTREKHKIQKELLEMNQSAKAQTSLRADAKVRDIKEQTKRARAKLEQSRIKCRPRRNSSPILSLSQMRASKGATTEKRHSISSKDVHDLRRCSLKTVGMLGGDAGSSASPSTGVYHASCQLPTEDKSKKATSGAEPKSSNSKAPSGRKVSSAQGNPSKNNKSSRKLKSTDS